MDKRSFLRAGLVGGTYILGAIIGYSAIFVKGLHFTTHTTFLATDAIIQHNMLAQLLMLSGLITFGVATLAIIMVNGMLLGAAIAVYVQQGKVFFFLLALLPHGIFEIGGLLISAYADLLLLECLVTYVRRSLREKHRNVLPVMLKRAIGINLLGIVALVIAGVIESSLTPHLIQMLLPT